MRVPVYASAGGLSRQHAEVARAQHLYVGVSVLVALIAFLGFAQSYWVPLASGALDLHPTVHVHAALFFVWTLLFIAQTALVASGRTRWHRDLGLAGIALASAMVFSGILATIVSLQALLPVRPEFARTGAALGFSSMALFTTFVALAIANIRRPERHKRLMLLASFSIVQAAAVRMFRLLPSIALADRIFLGAIAIDLLLLVVVLIERRSTGRVHPVWLLGGTALISVQYLRIAIVPTESWRNVTQWLAMLGA
jgi:hypothetical protein